MEKKQKLMIIAGVAAGAATAYYLTTPKGKAMKSKLINKTKDVVDVTVNKASELTEVAKDKASTIATTIVDTKNAFTEKATSTAVNQLGNLENGIAKAKAKLQNSVSV